MSGAVYAVRYKVRDVVVVCQYRDVKKRDDHAAQIAMQGGSCTMFTKGGRTCRTGSQSH